MSRFPRGPNFIISIELNLILVLSWFLDVMLLSESVSLRLLCQVRLSKFAPPLVRPILCDAMVWCTPSCDDIGVITSFLVWVAGSKKCASCFSQSAARHMMGRMVGRSRGSYSDAGEDRTTVHKTARAWPLKSRLSNAKDRKTGHDRLGQCTTLAGTLYCFPMAYCLIALWS